MTKAGSILIEIEGDNKDLKESVKSTNKSLGDMDNASKKASLSLKGIALGAAGIYAIGKAFSFATNAASNFVNTAAKFESFETTLRSITGSSEAASKSMEWIEDFGSKTPYTLDKVTEAFVKMKAYGLDPMDGTLKTLGNTASAMGKDIVQAVEAMADAITGENERLKEFGIKASKQGDKIAYAWSDSSGKARNIVIQNNKEMIKSTLNAILNEKYIGAMYAQSKTWDGMMSNMSDSWTIFQKQIMSAGLFDYFKGIAGVAGDSLSTAFGIAKDSGVEFSNSIISGIKNTIQAVGVLKDTFSIFSGVFGILKTAFWQMVGVFGEGMNAIQKAWNTLSNKMSQMWADMANGVKQVFETMINWIIEKINGLSGIVNEASSKLGLGNIFREIDKVHFEKTKAAIVEMGEPISNVETAWKNAEDARKSYMQDFKNVLGGEGQKQSLKIISDIETKMKDQLKTGAGLAKQKKDALKALEDLIKQQENLTLGAKKAAKSGGAAAKKAAKGASAAAKKAAKEASDSAKKSIEEVNNIMEESISSWEGMFENLFSGDISSGLKSLFGDITKDFQTSISSAFSSSGGASMGAAIGGFVGAAIGVGFDFISESILSSFRKVLSPAELKAAEGITGVQSESIVNSLERIDNNGTLGLKYSSIMADSLLKLVSLSDSAASHVGTNLTQEDYVDSVDYGIFRDVSKELVFSGIKIDKTSMEQLEAGILGGNQYIVEKVTKSGFLGTSIGASEGLETTLMGNIDPSIADPIIEAYKVGADAIQTAAEAFGISEDAFKDYVESWTTEVQNLNFKDKSQDEIADMINGAIASDLDNMASMLAELVPYMEEYTHAGEGQAETLIRLVNEFEVVERSFKDLTIVMPELAEGGVELSQALVEASGGVDKFADAMDAFISGFYTDEEQLKMLRTELTASMDALGLAMPASSMSYRLQVEGMLSTASASAVAAAEAKKYADSILLTGTAMQISAAQLKAVTLQDIADNDAEIAAKTLSLSSSMSEYFSGVESAANAAKAAQEEAEKLIETLRSGIASIIADWTTGGVESAQIMLDAVIKNTGIYGVNYNNFLEEFKKIANTEMSEDLLNDWQQMSSALKSLYDAQQALVQEQRDALNKELDFYKDVLAKIDDAYMGALSYLNSAEKAAYAEKMAAYSFNTGDTQSYIDYLGKQLEYEKKISITKEDYTVKFDEYIDALKKSEPEKTTDDVVEALDVIIHRIDNIEDAIERASYQEGK